MKITERKEEDFVYSIFSVYYILFIFYIFSIFLSLLMCNNMNTVTPMLTTFGLLLYTSLKAPVKLSLKINTIFLHTLLISPSCLLST